MNRIDEVKKGVKACHGNIRESQVDDEVIGHSPHSPVSEDNPDHCDVPSDGHQDDEGVRYGPESHLGEEMRSLMSNSYLQSHKLTKTQVMYAYFYKPQPIPAAHVCNKKTGLHKALF